MTVIFYFNAVPGLFGSKLYVENSREGICKTLGKELTWVGTLLRMYCWETDLMYVTANVYNYDLCQFTC